MSILFRYFMIVIACAALLAGIQIPNLADQYGKRVDAHLREVTINFQPFQDIANQHTHGKIDELIEMHRRSDIPTFRAEGSAIERMYQRKLRFEAEARALQTNLFKRVFHILLRPDSEMLEETLIQYSATVPLNQDAIIFGALFALVAMLLIEGLYALLNRGAQLATRWINHRWRAG